MNIIYAQYIYIQYKARARSVVKCHCTQWNPASVVACACFFIATTSVGKTGSAIAIPVIPRVSQESRTIRSREYSEYKRIETSLTSRDYGLLFFLEYCGPGCCFGSLTIGAVAPRTTQWCQWRTSTTNCSTPTFQKPSKGYLPAAWSNHLQESIPDEVSFLPKACAKASRRHYQMCTHPE